MTSRRLVLVSSPIRTSPRVKRRPSVQHRSALQDLMKMMRTMRGHPKHRDDADDDCAQDDFNHSVAAQMAQRFLRGKRTRDLCKPGRVMKPIDPSNRDHNKKEGDFR